MKYIKKNLQIVESTINEEGYYVVGNIAVHPDVFHRDYQPLGFTLTAEEVETVQYGLEEAISAYKEYMRKWEDRRDLSEYKFYIHQSNNLLTRIKKWQDEQENNNND